MRPHETLLVADSSPLIVLAKIGRLGLLPQLASQVVIPNAVWEEVVVNRPASLDSRQLADASWLKVMPVAADAPEVLGQRLDPGEAEAIALAERFPGCLLPMDERVGRIEAVRRRLRVMGTLGFLREAKTSGLIPSLRLEVERLRTVGFYLAPQLVEESLRSAGEL